MGNDGGSIPDRRDLVRSKPKAEQADKANQTRARSFFCALSKKPLAEPIVSDPLGKLYNKDAVLEFLLDRGAYGDGEEICGHLRSLKDVKTLRLTPVARPPDADDQPHFLCPLTQKAMTGLVPFVYLVPCGCVFSHAGLRAVAASPSPPSDTPSPPRDGEPASTKDGEPSSSSAALDVCPQCATKYDRRTGVRTINPSVEEEERMREAMLVARAARKGKKRKAAAVAEGVAENERAAKRATPPAARATQATNPTARAVQSALALEEAKRRAGMSEAVRSLYRDKNAQRKETFMTMGTFTRVRLFPFLLDGGQEDANAFF
ncbi:Rtf2 RING-finger-domain-containing protein [Vararia minispora EC-137]|uniref:Rtf2 RING-finger-domain-containing protein n=1 Tax=Vararia minispora EC-137 TaxID=1314806 RepID=A0ACB8QPT1_9AGAM|nr:Rtf2 RING-finger-domain-containing protein [Vararia minispora EC-137]